MVLTVLKDWTENNKYQESVYERGRDNFMQN